MSYELEFNESALKEWKKLDSSIKVQLKKQLTKRLENPHVPSAKLRGGDMKDAYKIKLRSAGYRLVYEVHDQTSIVLVLAVGRRDNDEVYQLARKRRC